MPSRRQKAKASENIAKDSPRFEAEEVPALQTAPLTIKQGQKTPERLYSQRLLSMR